MRRGCISLGNVKVKCGVCDRVIGYPERYVVVDEKEGVEVAKGESVRYCEECALAKGYAQYREEKGERILTFLP